MVGERPEAFPRVEDIDTTPGMWSRPPHPRRDAAWDIIPGDPEKFRQHVYTDAKTSQRRILLSGRLLAHCIHERSRRNLRGQSCRGLYLPGQWRCWTTTMG